MSAASTPAPSRSTPSSSSSSSRHSMFWPMLILIFGLGVQGVYQLMSLEDRQNAASRAIDDMDQRVKWAQYEKNKLYSLARDVLNLAPKDPNAQTLATRYNLQRLLDAQAAMTDTTVQSSTTNAASAQAPLTNAIPDTTAESTPASTSTTNK